MLCLTGSSLDTNSITSSVLQSVIVASVRDRVSSDLENLEMLGNFDAKRNSQGILKKTRKVSEFCCVKFIFSQSGNPNFENFLGEHVPRPLNSLGHT